MKVTMIMWMAMLCGLAYVMFGHSWHGLPESEVGEGWEGRFCKGCGQVQVRRIGGKWETIAWIKKEKVEQ